MTGPTSRVVVVGAGLSGLAAALHLAGAGREVTVLEREDIPGGRAGRLEVDGYSFDTGPTVLTMPDLVQEALDAVGGWFVLNDWSARDVQADDARHNVFGPVVKSKSFANSIGSDVVTADEFGDWKAATGRVRVDGEQWCEGATANPAHDLGEMLAYAARGERLDAGDVISTGTMPGCCGLEHDRWIKPGQTVELEIDGIGTLANRVNPTARPV